LDEAFGLAIGLGAIGFGEEMFEAQLVAASGKEFGAISGAAIGEDALDVDAMSLKESDGLMESGQDAGSFFIWEETRKGQAGMVIDGDVKGFSACARVALGTVAGGAHAGLMKAAQLLDIEVKKLPWSGAFVAHDRRPGRFEGAEAVEAVTLEDAGKGSFRDGKDHEDLGVRTALFAQGDDLGLEVR
jgi:hypothetical protein